MNDLTIGVFQDDALTRELGKKATESDILICHRKMGDRIFTFMSPVADKLTAKSQIVSAIDVAIVSFGSITRELGETLVMLDSIGISSGIALTSPYATADQIAMLTKNTIINQFLVHEKDPAQLLEAVKNFQSARVETGSVLVVIDHSFSVKGVGEVILGFVKRGIVKKYDKLTLLPANKEVIVRSIQVQDEEHEQAEAGTRVGLALKGTPIDELSRGSLLSADGNVKTSTRLELSFQKSPFYSEEVKQGAFHVTVGMQTAAVTISEVNDNSIVLETANPIAYVPKDTFLLLDLNAKKARVIGKAQAQ